MSPWGEKGRERHKHTRSLCMSAAVNVSVFKGLYCCRQNMPWTNTPLRCERIRDGCLFTVSSVFVCAYGVDSCPFHSVHFRCALFTMHFPHRFGFRSFLNLNAEWYTVYTVNLLCVCGALLPPARTTTNRAPIHTRSALASMNTRLARRHSQTNCLEKMFEWKRKRTTASPFKRYPPQINEYCIDRIAAVVLKIAYVHRNASGTNFVMIIIVIIISISIRQW